MTVDDELLDITNKWRSKKLEKWRSKKLEMLLLNKISTNCYALFRLIYLVPGKLDHINSPRSYYILVVLFWINAMDGYISRIIWHSIFYLQYSVAWDWTDALKDIGNGFFYWDMYFIWICILFGMKINRFGVKSEWSWPNYA